MEELAQEGAVQIFRELGTGMESTIKEPKYNIQSDYLKGKLDKQIGKDILDLAAEAARVADQLPELDALLEARARAACETAARISREARTVTGEVSVGEETVL